MAHVVNPVTVGPESDLFVAQPVTFRSMVEARERAKTDLAVELYTVSFPEDNIPSPPAFSTLPPLKRSVLDVGRFERERKLPLIRDVLDAVIHATDADNIIYSNVDISLMPGFYRYVSAKLSDYDALVINRRTIEKAETADFPLEHFYAQPGSLHPGFDCFAFKRALYSRFSLGQACIGANWIGRIVLVNMMAYAANIWVEKEDHLTFHLGDDRSWKITANIDFDEHNASVLGRTMAKIANDGLLSKHSLLKRTYEEFTLKMRDPDPGRPKRGVYPGFPTPFRGFAWVIRWESPCGSSWKTRSVFQGAVGAFGASTVPCVPGMLDSSEVQVLCPSLVETKG